MRSLPWLGAALGLFVAGCPAHIASRPKIVTTTVHDLPDDRETLLKISDASCVDGPSGPDLPRSLAAAEKILKTTPNDGDALWRAARAVYYRSMSKPDPESASRCMGFGSLAVEHSKSAQAHFYFALCMGMRAQAVNSEGLGLIKDMVNHAEAAVAADPSIAHGGPFRLLGGIFLRAPPWPTSVGDGEAACEHLQKAVELDKSWPENHLLLAEALLEEDRDDEAKKALQRARENLDASSAKGWKSSFSVHLADLEAKLVDR